MCLGRVAEAANYGIGALGLAELTSASGGLRVQSDDILVVRGLFESMRK